MGEVTVGTYSSVENALEAINKKHKNMSYSLPWWGDKESESGNMSNRGFVIGFRDPGKSAQWRLDYDPDKKKLLHINWTQEVNGQETTKQCFNVSSIRPIDTMWDYYVSWTRRHLDTIPAEIKARLDKVGGTKSWKGRYWSA